MQIVQPIAAGTEAVKKLRRHELDAGNVFMINSKLLPDGQFYIELPTGIIQLAVISDSKKDYEIIRQLDDEEAACLRAQYDLD